jgi:hypothetical protein
MVQGDGEQEREQRRGLNEWAGRQQGHRLFRLARLHKQRQQQQFQSPPVGKG